MRNLLVATLLSTFAFSAYAQEQELPQGCLDFIAYSKKMWEEKEDTPAKKAEMAENIKGLEAEFAEAVKLNGKEAAGKGCTELLEMMKEMAEKK